MSRRRSKKLPTEPVEAQIVDLTHEGLGVAKVDGKTVFVDSVLPGEIARFRYTRTRRNYDEARLLEILTASTDRVEPKCLHFNICGGCNLQHLAHPRQIELKQNILLEDLKRIGDVVPAQVNLPIQAEPWGYRRKARLGVKYVIKKDQVLVGFREKASSFLAELSACEVLVPVVGQLLTPLAELIYGLQARQQIPQVEVAVADNTTALIFRHLKPLVNDDLQKLTEFAQTHKMDLYLQPGGPATIHLHWPQQSQLIYRLDDQDLTYDFGPTDFIQINRAINQSMINAVLSHLQLSGNETVLELFCGLGNISLPLAQQSKFVVSVEGDQALVDKAKINARQNDISNVEFHMANLYADDVELLSLWKQHTYDIVVLDPPRSGAENIMPIIKKIGAHKIVYVSCNPATLARDAKLLLENSRYCLKSAGILDMFPHTAHVESMAVFELDK